MTKVKKKSMGKVEKREGREEKEQHPSLGWKALSLREGQTAVVEACVGLEMTVESPGNRYNVRPTKTLGAIEQFLFFILRGEQRQGKTGSPSLGGRCTAGRPLSSG